MSEIAIRIEGLSKQYRIGERQLIYKTIRETLTDAFVSPFRKARALLEGQAAAADRNQTIWALHDISLEIKQGEVVGIIGRNGAGKSTLLKVLSRITEPTVGSVEIHGRVSSLLEVGTGFHHELTGRENVFLNGAILGMRRAEIEQRFEEIVAFAEVEQFLDTPVKHYSSGMYLRLAFAVAAHLEPEILIVDEVLAVGDARFQKKCLNKMEDVGRQGRTVLFVSHNMPAISRLCERVVLLDGGVVAQDGPAPQVVGTYLASGLGIRAVREWPDPAGAPGGGVIRLRAVRVETQEGQIADSIDIRQPVSIAIEYEVRESDHVLIPFFALFNEEGIELFPAHDHDPAWRRRPRPSGRYVSTGTIPGNFLAEGTMVVSVGCLIDHPPRTHFWERDIVAFHVVDRGEGESARGDYEGVLRGAVRPLLNWSTRFTPGQ